MEYFYNQNKNHGYYDQPTHATGHAMATVSMLMGLVAVTTGMTIFLPVFFGGLSIIFAVLSRGFEQKIPRAAAAGMVCSICGIAIAATLFLIQCISIINNPSILLDFGRENDQLFLQTYGQSAEALLGYSYEDIMRQFMQFFL